MWRRNQRQAADPGRPRVIVVGAGFAGLAATGQLARGGAVCIADRPERVQHVPAAAVPGGHRRAEPGRRVLPGPRVHPALRGPVPAGRAGRGGPGGPPGHAGRRRAVRLRLPGAGHRGVGRLLRGARRGRAQPRPVHPAGQRRAAQPHHGPAGAAGHRWPGRRGELHRGRRRGDRGGAGRRAGRAAQHRAGRRVPRGGPGRGAHPAGRAGARAAAAVPPAAARVCPAAAGRAGASRC